MSPQSLGESVTLLLRFSWIMLVVQAGLAVVGLHALRSGAQAAVRSGGARPLLINVVVPLALVVPMVLLAVRVNNSVHGLGWIPIGGPISCAMFAVACAMIVGIRFEPRGLAPKPRLLAMWICTGVVLLLVTAAHELAVMVGQVAFAAAAVLLWFNTPDETPAEINRAQKPSRGHYGLEIAAFCSLGQAILALMIDPSVIKISGALMVTYAAMGSAIIACILGPGAAVAAGGWGAIYGVLFGLGLMSLREIVPLAIRTILGGDPTAFRHVAFGFGAYAPEAALMLAVAAVGASMGRIQPYVQRIAGICLAHAAAIWCAWRLSGV